MLYGQCQKMVILNSAAEIGVKQAAELAGVHVSVGLSNFTVIRREAGNMYRLKG